MNKGLNLAKGDIIGFKLDDYYYENSLKLVNDYLIKTISIFYLEVLKNTN